MVLAQEKAYANQRFCSAVAGEFSIAYDDFRGISEGTWNGNTGSVFMVNFGTSLYDTLGVQGGGSYGVYDWYGRSSTVSNNPGSVQSQGFITTGLFYKTPCLSGLQAGVVLDWMFNENFGVFGLDPNFGQLRFQAGYLLNGCQEFGILGTTNLRTAHETAFEIPISYRAVAQVSLFWRRFFRNCSEAMFWVGIPYNESLMFSGKRSGQYIAGAALRAPLTSSLSLEAHGVYMGPPGNSSVPHFVNYSANVCIGLSYAFGTGSKERCDQWLARPYLPVANNSNFLVDASLND